MLKNESSVKYPNDVFVSIGSLGKESENQVEFNPSIDLIP